MGEVGAETSEASEEPQARRFSFSALLDGFFFVFAGVASVWLAWLVFTESFAFGWWGIAFFILFWAVLAYLVLPRLHQRRPARRPCEPRARRRGGVAARGLPRRRLDPGRRHRGAIEQAHHHLDDHSPQLRRGTREPALPVRAAAGLRLPAGG